MIFRRKGPSEQELSDTLIEFYRRAPVIAPQPKEPFQIRSEIQKLGGNWESPENTVKVEVKPNARVLGGPVPAAPVIHDTDHGVDNIRLYWTHLDNPLSGGAAVTYNIYQNITGFNSFYRIAQFVTGGSTPVGGVRSYLMGNYPADTDIYFYMTAVNEIGEGEASSPVTIVRTDPITPPSPPFPPGAIFDVTGSRSIHLGATNGYGVTMRAEPTFNDEVLFNLQDGFVTVYDAGGTIRWAGQPYFVVTPSNPKAMTDGPGFALFNVRVEVPVTVPGGSFVNGYIRYDIRNPLLYNEPHQVYGDPNGQPFNYEALIT